VAVLLEAAHLYRAELGDADSAIALYGRVLASPEAEPAVALGAAHSLNELLAAAGRHPERLTVLEKLSTLEQSSAVRRFVLGEAARLADGLGDPDRALASWRPVLAADEHDVEALAAVAELLERNQRWDELCQALRRRAGAKVLPLQRRADLVRIAEVQEQHLGKLDAAVDTWMSIRAEFGEDGDVLGALDRLLGALGRHRDLAGVLGGAATRERERASRLLTRLGQLEAGELGEPPAALLWYRQALMADPGSPTAREGMRALLVDAATADEAARALARAYEATDDWRLLLELTDLRLGAAGSRIEQARLLREAALMHLERAKSAEEALGCLCRALPFEPESLATQAQLLKLAETTGRWNSAAASLRLAAEATRDAPRRRAELRKVEGRICEERLNDVAAALTAYFAAVEAAPDDPEALEAAARCAARAGRFDDACRAAVRSVALRDRVRPELVASLEAAAEGDGWRALADALIAAIAEARLTGRPAQELEMRVAGWLRDRVGDVDAAEAAAARAAAGSQPAALDLLASLQRHKPGPALVDTLLAIDRHHERSLDALSEAARVALGGQDTPRILAILERLYRKAAGMWMRGDTATGELGPAAVAEWALDELVSYHVASGNAERAVHAVMEGTRLPLGKEKTIALRRRAANMLAERGETARAIDVYRGVLDESPRDVEALQRLAAMCEEVGRVSEALALRLRELELVEDLERRLELRLAHSRLTGALEEQGGRVASLRQNLEDAPGHEPSIDELSRVLEERGKHAELADILAGQAQKLESTARHDRAARLWFRVADIAERALHDPARAVAAHVRTVLMAPSNESLDALARLHLDRGEPAEAARWLERRLETTAPVERVAVLLKLAHARIRAEQREAAVEALRTAFDEAPKNAEVRKLLFNLYRAGKDWEALADTLTRATMAVADDATVLAYAREAADIYRERLGAPQRAVPVLEKAVALAPDERELRLGLAEGQRLAGQLDRARELLEQLVADFGRRRSPERARVHLELARVLHDQAQNEPAIDQLETAAGMDPGNIDILAALAELAREAGQLDRAERAYRTLLVSVRREADAQKLPIGPTVVLLALSRIAADRGDAAKANELYESVLESLAQNDYEAPRVQDALRGRGDHELCRRVLEHRLGYVRAPHKRAAIFADLAELFEGPLERPGEAVRARLDAVKTDPGSPLHHEAAWRLAAQVGRLDGYVSTVEALLSDERADDSPLVRCELLLRLGEVLEKERGDLDRAAAVYEQADATGVRSVDVWRAQARVAAARGDTQEQMRLLGRLASLGEDQAETRADALYRLAEVQLAAADTIDDGIASLGKALGDQFRAERAAMVLRRACDAHAEHQALLDLYEQVARKSEDRQVLLHYLERRSFHPAATPEQVREAVDVARELGELGRAETLMMRAAALGDGLHRADDKKRIDWAMLGLAERRMAAGDLAGAVKWLTETSEAAELGEVLALAERIAELAAGPHGDLTLAAKLYERLLERAPTSRKAWQPLAELYARLGDVERLERMVDETLDGLQDPADRNALRIALARALLEGQGAAPERADRAVKVLGDVLVDNPQDDAAQALLVTYLENSGRLDELVTLLRRQLEAAVDRQDAVAIKLATLRLAARVEAKSRDEALDVLRRALRWVPDDHDLLTGLLGRLGDDDDPHERAELTEALVKIEAPAEAEPRALALVALYEGMNDDDGLLRALKLGTQRAPGSIEIRERLQARYRDRGDFVGLCDSLLDAAQRAEEPHGRAALLREAALVRRERLGDPAGAADLLRQASGQLADDLGLRIELASTLSQAGQHEQAVATMSAALELCDDDPARLEVLRTRAHLRAASGDEDGAVSDLEQAFDLDRGSVAAELEEALGRRLEWARSAGDDGAERSHTLRAVDVMLVRDKRVEASQLLSGWTSRHPDDLEALRRQRDLDAADGRWDAVAATCSRLVHVESGAAQIDAALGLSHAYQVLGRPDGAREGLEHVRAAQPQSAEVRAELRKIYEHLGDEHQLARLLSEDAEGIEDPAARAELLARAGRIFVELGDANAAIAPLRGALALVPGDVAAIIALADAYILAGWFDDANEHLDQAIAAGRGRRTPEMCVFHHRKAQIAGAQGDRTRQLFHLQEAHLCNKKNGLVAAELATVAEELGDLDLAAKTLRTITLIDTECPISRGEAFLRQAKIALVQGDEKSAMMWARRAKREEPDNAAVDTFLEELGERAAPSPGRR
jgi:tetratricopeptide (TPR) repeat protein